MLQSAEEILRRRMKSDKRMRETAQRFSERREVCYRYLRICLDFVQFVLEIAERKVDNEDTCNGRASAEYTNLNSKTIAYYSTVSV